MYGCVEANFRTPLDFSILLWTLDMAAEGRVECPFMEPTPDTKDTPDTPVSPDPKSKTSVQEKALEPAVVMTVVEDLPAPEEAILEEPAEVIPDIKPGAMGLPRIRLMQALGVDVNHTFDAEIEDKIREKVPSYDGTVNAEVRAALGY